MIISDPTIYFLILILGAFVAAFVTGAVGFADGLIFNAFWLHIMDPIAAVQLVIVASLIVHLQPLYKLRQELNYTRLRPFAFFGIVGVPLGIALLIYSQPALFKAGVGVLLLTYGVWMLGKSGNTLIGKSKKVTDSFVGFVGGVMGGFSGIGGLLPTIWMNLQNENKNTQRGTYEPFILFINIAGITGFVIAGKITESVFSDLLVIMPALMIGSWLGIKIYPKLNEVLFRKIVLGCILLSGLGLLVI